MSKSQNSLNEVPWPRKQHLCTSFSPHWWEISFRRTLLSPHRSIPLESDSAPDEHHARVSVGSGMMFRLTGFSVTKDDFLNLLQHSKMTARSAQWSAGQWMSLSEFCSHSSNEEANKFSMRKILEKGFRGMKSKGLLSWHNAFSKKIVQKRFADSCSFLASPID